MQLPVFESISGKDFRGKKQNNKFNKNITNNLKQTKLIKSISKNESTNYYLKLSNNSTNACFANVIVQALISCGDLLFNTVSSITFWTLWRQIIKIFINWKVKKIQNKNTISTIIESFLNLHELQNLQAQNTMKLRQAIDILSNFCNFIWN